MKTTLVVHGISDVSPGQTASAVARSVAAAGDRITTHQVRLDGQDVPVFEVTRSNGETLRFVDAAWADLSPSPRSPFTAIWIVFRNLIRLCTLNLADIRCMAPTPYKPTVETLLWFGGLAICTFLPGLAAAITSGALLFLLCSALPGLLGVVLIALIAWPLRRAVRGSTFGPLALLVTPLFGLVLLYPAVQRQLSGFITTALFAPGFALWLSFLIASAWGAKRFVLPAVSPYNTPLHPPEHHQTIVAIFSASLVLSAAHWVLKSHPELNQQVQQSTALTAPLVGVYSAWLTLIASLDWFFLLFSGYLLVCLATFFWLPRGALRARFSVAIGTIVLPSMALWSCLYLCVVLPLPWALQSMPTAATGVLNPVAPLGVNALFSFLLSSAVLFLLGVVFASHHFAALMADSSLSLPASWFTGLGGGRSKERLDVLMSNLPSLLPAVWSAPTLLAPVVLLQRSFGEPLTAWLLAQPVLHHFTMFSTSLLLATMGLLTTMLLRVADMAQDVLSMVERPLPGRWSLATEIDSRLSLMVQFFEPSVVVCHSQGSLAVSRQLRSWPSVKVVVSCGSPLQNIYQRYLPDYTRSACEALLSNKSDVIRLNYYFDTDYVGRHLWSQPQMHCRDLAMGPGGHTQYFNPRLDHQLRRDLKALYTSEPISVAARRLLYQPTEGSPLVALRPYLSAPSRSDLTTPGSNDGVTEDGSQSTEVRRG